jgi:hypothetical protein
MTTDPQDDDLGPEEVDALTNDLRLASLLLTGTWTEEGADPQNKRDDRYPGKRYLEGNLEREAREAIGRLLRNKWPLDHSLRYRLAELFDGLPPYTSPDGAPMAREVVFAHRRAGRPKEIILRDLHLATDYRRLVEDGLPHKRAVDQVCKKYNVSDTTVKEARRNNPSLAQRAVKKRIGHPK